MNSDFGSDIFDDSPQPPKEKEAVPSDAKASPPPEARAPERDAESSPGEDGDHEGAPEGKKRRRKRSRSRRKGGDDESSSGPETAPETTPAETDAPANEAVPQADRDDPADSAAQDQSSDSGDRTDGDDDRRPGRKRGRRGRGGDRGDRDRSDSRNENRNENRNRDSRRDDRTRRKDRPRRDREESRGALDHLDLPTRQRIAIFVDATELQAASPDKEISFGHLRRHVARSRVPIRAIAYYTTKQKALGKSLTHAGFEATAVDSKSATNIAIAVDAMGLADRVDCVILVPGTNSLAHLAKTLRARGVRVESASFKEEGESKLGAQEHVTVGGESCFVV